MRQIDIDWHYLGRDLAVPLVTTAVAIVLLLASGLFVRVQEDGYSRISIDKDAVNADYDALVVRKRLVDRYHRRYERFWNRGFIGEENRLEWIETLRLAAEDLELPNLAYSLEPQLAVVPPVPSSSVKADAQVFVSKLELEIGLLHEIDLLRLFDALQTRAPGLVKADRCSLLRQAEQGARTSSDPNIVANCSLAMFSIVTPDVSDPVPSI